MFNIFKHDLTFKKLGYTTSIGTNSKQRKKRYKMVTSIRR